jgi:hypothetical protein
MSSTEIRIRCGNIEDPNAPIVYADLDKMEALFDNLNAADNTNVINKQVTRDGSSVRRYPGDPSPYSRSGSTAVISVIPRPFYQTTPGVPFTVETPADLNLLPPGGKRKVRQFTLLDSWTKFHAFAVGNAKVDMVLRSPGGVPSIVEAAGP